MKIIVYEWYIMDTYILIYTICCIYDRLYIGYTVYEISVTDQGWELLKIKFEEKSKD